MNAFTHSIAIATLLMSAGCASTGQSADPNHSIAVTIPFGSYDPLQPFSPTTRHANEFYILLTNVTRKPLRVWQEWCSWGYYSLELEVTEQDGTKHLLKKKRTDFYANFEDYINLAQGEAVVWKVDVRASQWEDLSWLPDNEVRPVKLRALFTIKKDIDSERYGIWTGHEASEEYQFILAKR